MNIGIFFALFSMFFAGINDVVFKRYSIEDRSRGIYIDGNCFFKCWHHSNTLRQ